MNPFSGRPPPEISEPSFIDKPGERFMELVFDDLKPGDVGVAPNADKSVYYVAKVVDRTPANRELFMKTPLFGRSTPYEQLAAIEQQRAIYRFSQDLDRKYAVKWTVADAGEAESSNSDE